MGKVEVYATPYVVLQDGYWLVQPHPEATTRFGLLDDHIYYCGGVWVEDRGYVGVFYTYYAARGELGQLFRLYGFSIAKELYLFICNSFYALIVAIDYELLDVELVEYIEAREGSLFHIRAGVVGCSARAKRHIALPHAGLVDLGVDCREVHRIDIALAGHNEPRAVA